MKITRITKNELPQVINWLAQGLGNFKHRQKVLNLIEQAPRAHPELHFVLRDENGSLLSHLAIARKSLRVGEVQLRTGLVGSVYTPPEHRRRGYALKVMEEVNKIGPEEGFDVLYLSSSPMALNLYKRAGYEIFINDYFTDISVLKLLKLNKKINYMFRKIEKNDLNFILELYRELSARTSWSVLRNREYWEWLYQMSSLGEYWNDDFSLVVEKRKKLLGYVICRYGNFHGQFSEERITVLEAWHREEVAVKEFYEAIVIELARRCLEKGISLVSIGLDQFHPLHHFARTELRCISQSFAKHDMIFFPRVTTFLRRIVPELKRRIDKSFLINKDFSLTVNFGGEKVIISKKSGSLKITSFSSQEDISFDQPRSWQILSGYQSPAEVIPKTKSSPEKLETLQVLFPSLNNWASHLDSY